MTDRLLDKINYPADLRKLNRNQLSQVSKELRVKISKIGIIQNSNNKPILIDKKRGIISLKNKGYFHHF